MKPFILFYILPRASCLTPSTSRWRISCTSDPSQSSYLCLKSHLPAPARLLATQLFTKPIKGALAETHLHNVRKDYPTTINQKHNSGLQSHLGNWRKRYYQVHIGPSSTSKAFTSEFTEENVPLIGLKAFCL